MAMSPAWPWPSPRTEDATPPATMDRSRGRLSCPFAGPYPLSVAVSRDGGHSWTHARVLERATAGVGQYAYPTLLFHDGRALMTYYVADAAGIGLAFRSIPIDRLLRAP